MSAGDIEAQFRHEAAVRGDLRRINWWSSALFFMSRRFQSRSCRASCWRSSGPDRVRLLAHLLGFATDTSSGSSRPIAEVLGTKYTPREKTCSHQDLVARQTNESNGPGMLNVSRAAVTLLSGLTGLGTRNTRSGTESLSPEVHAYAINTKDTEYEYRLARGRDFSGKPCTSDAGKPT